MKKSLSRILSLALVLAMLISVVPFALASETVTGVTITGGSGTVAVGGTVTFSAEVSVDGSLEEGETAVSREVTWESSNPSIATVENGVVTGVAVGTTTITATSVANPSASATARIMVEKASVTPEAVPASLTLTVKDQASVTASVPGLTAEDFHVTWASNDTTVATCTADGAVDAVAAGRTTLTGTVTLTTTGDAKATLKTNTVTCPVTVNDQYEATLSRNTLNMLKGEDVDALTVTVKKAGTAATTGFTVVWVSDNEAVATVANGKITAVAAGTATITANVKVEGTVVASDSCVVTVNNGGIICPNVSKVSSYYNTVTLEPKYGVNGVYDDDVTFKFEKAGTTGSVTDKGVVTCTGSGLVKVKITAFRGTDELGNTTVYVSFYESADIDVTMKSTLKSFAFGDATALTGGKALSSLIFGQLVDYANNDDIQFSYSDTTGKVAVLELPAGSVASQDKTALINLGKVVFKLTGGTGKDWKFGYTVKRDDIILGVGSVTINFTGSAGDIVYATDYKTDVTFDEYDFQKFWTADKTTTGTLQYVEFGVGTSVPNRGRLYTTVGKTKQVTSSMAFKPDFTSSATYYDLDTVTYEPSSLYTTYYTVEIPFTAYGSNNQTLNGTVVIEINGSSSSITSRGVRFGNTSIVADMAEEYYGKTGKELSYATFYLPDVEDGRLFYNYSGILESARVTSKDKFYYYASNVKTRPNADLDQLTFVPAAGTTGKITLYYTAYDKDGNNAYNGTIVLTVSAKTKSDKFTDVNASSYSWAADSIDFLYYEEVVQGSGSKYNPASSITRGDFMIMLYRAFLEDKYGSYTVTSNFADVVKGTDSYSKETYQAVGVAKYLGIAKGDGTNFKPKSSITREEAMTLIYRTLEKMDIDLEYAASKTTASFSDYSKVSTYAQTSISYLIRHGIVIGSNGLINPKSNITRAEMAVILHRVLTY